MTLWDRYANIVLFLLATAAVLGLLALGGWLGEVASIWITGTLD